MTDGNGGGEGAAPSFVCASSFSGTWCAEESSGGSCGWALSSGGVEAALLGNVGDGDEPVVMPAVEFDWEGCGCGEIEGGAAD